jgi:lactate permease
MKGGTWRKTLEVWPGMLVSGGSFAPHLITDVVAGVVSVVCTALLLRFVWHPKARFLLKWELSGAAAFRPPLWGTPAFKKMLNAVSVPA